MEKIKIQWRRHYKNAEEIKNDSVFWDHFLTRLILLHQNSLISLLNWTNTLALPNGQTHTHTHTQNDIGKVHIPAYEKKNQKRLFSLFCNVMALS